MIDAALFYMRHPLCLNRVKNYSARVDSLIWEMLGCRHKVQPFFHYGSKFCTYGLDDKYYSIFIDDGKLSSRGFMNYIMVGYDPCRGLPVFATDAWPSFNLQRAFYEVFAVPYLEAYKNRHVEDIK